MLKRAGVGIKTFSVAQPERSHEKITFRTFFPAMAAMAAKAGGQEFGNVFNGGVNVMTASRAVGGARAARRTTAVFGGRPSPGAASNKARLTSKMPTDREFGNARHPAAQPNLANGCGRGQPLSANFSHVATIGMSLTHKEFKENRVRPVKPG
jgi:hypothetical protein